MLTGVHPFRGDSHMRLLSNVVNRDPILPPHLPPDAASLIQGLLCKQPRLRLGSVGRKFVEIQDHPFFAGLDWAKVEAKGYPMEFMPPIESDFDVSNFGSQYTSEKFSGANSSACATSDASSQPPMEHPTQSSQRSGPSSDDHNNSYVVRCSQQSSDTTHGSQYRKFSGFSFAGPPDVEGSGC
ncbi:hypothetical protein DYB32_000606 [Aphanomyces invadans]|uniref:AGC-kinase C-terminal domain-containing protein n=1 Tax=Aphanomyces invadans TaxID=157072 RepID=A0A3R6ZWY3_9STRA|nr:hypothetical protein DYB32_000606 [Aphanomyces invadans]